MNLPRSLAEAAEARTATLEDQGAESNRLLRALPSAEYQRLMGDLEPVELPVRYRLWESEEPIEVALFPRTCVVSLVARMSDGAAVEAATVGCEGVAGVAVMLGARTTGMRCFVQVPGEGLRMPAALLRERATQMPALRSLLLRYAHMLWEQTAQSVACNRLHSVEERCARWLLMTHDRAGGREFLLTQDFLSQMLGVRRPSVTVAAGMLQRAGLIRYSRGRVIILDRRRLEDASCECFAAVQARYEALFGASAGA